MYQLILCNCPDITAAEQLAQHLVKERLAACVNLVPGIRSVYQWQGSIETAQEIMLLIKTQTVLYPAIEEAIKRLHPYEIPEIIAVAIADGSGDYLKWMDSCLHTA